MICENGGCMAKVSGVYLEDLISESIEKTSLDGQNIIREIGKGEFNDCALIKNRLLTTVDFGPLVGDDYKIAGKISALNALSDVYVNGGKPQYALVILTLASNLSMQNGSDLLSGVFEACNEEQVTIIGGHTIRGAETLVGLSVIGDVVPQCIIRKKGAQVNDLLWISKPIGTGLVLRGYYNHLLNKEHYMEAMNVMLESNGQLVKKITKQCKGIHSMTDATGFGIIGHLVEMLDEKQGAVLYAKELPLLSSLTKLNAFSMRSSYISNNYEYACSRKYIDIKLDGILSLALFDPQTNGPVLVITDGTTALSNIDSRFVCIGEITENNRITVI